MKVFISILAFLFFKSIAANIPTQLIVTRVGPCLDQKPTELVKVSEMSLHKDGSATSLSGPLQILKDIENGWSVKATMQKCHDIRNLDTCDFYKATAIIREGCEQEEDLTLFEDFAKYFSPRLNCPIQGGNYTLRRFPYDTSSILINAKSKISTSVFGYTYRLEGFNFEDNRIFCIDSKLRMIYVRKHNWIGSQKLEREGISTEVTTKTIETEDRYDKNDNEENTEKLKGNKSQDNINNNAHIDDEGGETGDIDQAEAETANEDSETENGHSETKKYETGTEEGDTETEKSETESEKDETEAERSETECKKDETETEKGETDTAKDETQTEKGGIVSEKGQSEVGTGTTQAIPTTLVSENDPENDNEEVGSQPINIDIPPTENEDDE